VRSLLKEGLDQISDMCRVISRDVVIAMALSTPRRHGEALFGSSGWVL